MKEITASSTVRSGRLTVVYASDPASAAGGADFRRIGAALKMITDMERIGDQAADIADIVLDND
ncbi:MAG: PhoU domain-containing protein [Eubacteriales bacterium]